MRAFSICAAVCLTMLPGRAGADIPATSRAEQDTARVAETVYYPPAYADRWQRPWTDNRFRPWQPRPPYPSYAPRYPNRYGTYGYRSYGGYPPRYGNTWQYGRPSWPQDRYTQRPWLAPSQPGYTWNRAPDYRWAGTARPRTYDYGSGYQDWRQQWRW